MRWDEIAGDVWTIPAERYKTKKANAVPLSGEVRRLVTSERLPHMGWNTLTVRPGSALLDGIPEGAWLYFVHSYAPVPDDGSVVAATTDYGGAVVAAVERGPLWATQFHPEKSAANGLRLLTNFARACATQEEG